MLDVQKQKQNNKTRHSDLNITINNFLSFEIKEINSTEAQNAFEKII
jgi:hypothetical protein